MNILYCGDVGIEKGVLVSVLSFLMNGKKYYDSSSGKMMERDEAAPEYHFFILTIEYEDVRPFEQRAADYLDSLVKQYNKKSFVKLIDATEAFVANLPEKNMGSYFTPASMLRLYMDKIPEIARLKRVLYLDYDVMCRGNISDFYETNLDGAQAAGVQDIYGKYFYHYRGLLNFDYMNSGVMLFNMDECLRAKVFERAVKLCMRRRMMLADQAALNKAIERRKLMPRRYNEQGERPRPDTVLHHFSNNFEFWPVFHVQKVKPFEVERIHQVLKINEYDDVLNKFKHLKGNL